MIEFLQTAYLSNDMQAKNRIIAILANILDRKISEDEKTAVALIIREALFGKHFDRASAKETISHLYYISEDGKTYNAPFVSEDKGCELYEEYRNYITDYNEYDFFVVLNDVIANFHNLLHAWWQDEDAEILTTKYCELAVNWLNDDDTKYHGEKAWRLLSGKK